MDGKVEDFFCKEENQVILNRFLVRLQSFQYVQSPNPDVIGQLKIFFSILIQKSFIFDKYCTANIEWIGNQFIDSIKKCDLTDPESDFYYISTIFTMSYRFVCELEFSNQDGLIFELSNIKNFVLQNQDKFSTSEQSQLIYANYQMPMNIVRRMLHSKEIQNFMDFSRLAVEAKNLKEEWTKEIELKSAEIDALKDGLDRVTTTYNFVGLVKGFESLASTKRKEKNLSFGSLLFLGILMMSPVLLQLWFTVSHIDTIESHKNTLIYSLPPLIALEVILLYFFRVVLSQFRGVTSQLLQINLRITLCQFIQSYSEYSTKIKKQDASALEKFENLIFGSINFSTEALPSTFDGMDQIAKLINSIRSGK